MQQIAEGIETGTLRTVDCGRADYGQVLELQKQLHDERLSGLIPDTVIVVEHPPVITLGARQSANSLLVSREELLERQIDLAETRRGGGITAHNPGQIVFYPILHLRQLGLGINGYIRELETIGIELLGQLGVAATRRAGFPGLWVVESHATNSPDDKQRDTRYGIRDTRKVASIGVRLSKGVTYHGMAINIQNDLSIFDLIVPCGLAGVEMTSVLRETGKRHPMNDVKKRLSALLTARFGDGQREPVMVCTAHPTIPTRYETRATSDERRNLPPWLRRPLPATQSFQRTHDIVSSLGLQTICSNANCPNRGECWSRGTATVLILGNICTRKCGFCAVSTGKPSLPDPTEPSRLAEMVEQMGLRYLVITSVNRDDLADGGAAHFRDCITEVRQRYPDTRFEILTPDFCGCQKQALEIVSQALPFVFAHNVETAPSLYPVARAGGDYRQSLNLLRLAKRICGDIQTKSSIMLGLGESDEEIEQVLKDLRDVGCDRVTVGQYLKPSADAIDVVEYVTPEKFDRWREKALALGFSWVHSSPFARSSHLAERQVMS